MAGRRKEAAPPDTPVETSDRVVGENEIYLDPVLAQQRDELAAREAQDPVPSRQTEVTIDDTLLAQRDADIARDESRTPAVQTVSGKKK